jgi:hypothetical protein
LVVFGEKKEREKKTKTKTKRKQIKSNQMIDWCQG